jgi:hypothetical protein
MGIQVLLTILSVISTTRDSRCSNGTLKTEDKVNDLFCDAEVGATACSLEKYVVGVTCHDAPGLVSSQILDPRYASSKWHEEEQNRLRTRAQSVPTDHLHTITSASAIPNERIQQ